MKAILMLEDGKSFSGEGIGVKGDTAGEVIFNTAVVGYQEMLTDPANAGKILTLTYPLIGNYGVAPKFNESSQAWVSGLVIKEKSNFFSNWQAKDSLDNFLKAERLVAITAVDTRTLAVHLRQKGQMLGVISTQTENSKELLAQIEAFRKQNKESRLPEISVKNPAQLGNKKAKYKIVILDLGITQGILRQLSALGASITLLPYQTKPQEILRLKAQGLIISSGPEEDSGLAEVVNNVKALVGRLPILGIATGHQVLARALGAKVIKMKLGHHGVNYPVHHPASYKGEITVQNHSCVVDTDSLHKIKHLAITSYNLNDRSVEEMESKKLKFIGVQYMPVSPGFGEVNPIFYKFLKIIRR